MDAPFHHVRTFFRRTRKGDIVKTVREHYLRDDLWCGVYRCHRCGADTRSLARDLASCGLSLASKTLLVIDTNVALHHTDLLQHPQVEFFFFWLSSQDQRFKGHGLL